MRIKYVNAIFMIDVQLRFSAILIRILHANQLRVSKAVHAAPARHYCGIALLWYYCGIAAVR